MSISRRKLLQLSTAVFSALGFVPRKLFGQDFESQRKYLEAMNEIFAYGLASGDPLSDRVILWTHIGTEQDVEAVRYEVALDPEFRQIVSEGQTEARRENDHTVKVDAKLPYAATTYYYRFEARGLYSMVGRTRSAPQNADNVRVAVVSCSSIWSGYMNAYEMIARRNDIDLVIHCGDYVYDVPDEDEHRNMPADAEDTKYPGSLADHRRRFRYYRKDRYLRRAHQQHPWAMIWDNHDIVTGAPRHDSVKAFREWTPIRDPRPGQDQYIYRTLSYGPLVKIVMLDTRHIGRDEQIEGRDGLSILGNEQYRWFQSEMAGSQAKWNLVANQVQMAHFEAFGKPLAKDSWAKYPKDRERVYEMLSNLQNKNTLFVTGDAHLSFGSDLNYQGRPVGVEFLPTSVSRGGIDEEVKGFLGTLASVFAPAALTTLNPHIKYFEGKSHGYGIVDLRADQANCEFWYITIEEQSADEWLGHSFQVRSGDGYIGSHHKVTTKANYQLGAQAPAEPQLYLRGEEIGGRSGTNFDAMEVLPKNPRLREVKLRSGDRIDQFSFSYADGPSFVRGGQGGQERGISLAEGEVIRSITISTGNHKGSGRVFYIQIKTSNGQILEGGKRTKHTITMDAPAGRHIIGFYGRSGSELDKLGPIFAADY